MLPSCMCKFDMKQLRPRCTSKCSSFTVHASHPAAKLPDSSQLSYIQQLDPHFNLDDLDNDDSDAVSTTETLYPPVLISNGLPPVPFRLVKHEEDGLFVEMADYLDSVDLDTEDRRATVSLISVFL